MDKRVAVVQIELKVGEVVVKLSATEAQELYRELDRMFGPARTTFIPSIWPSPPQQPIWNTTGTWHADSDPQSDDAGGADRGARGSSSAPREGERRSGPSRASAVKPRHTEAELDALAEKVRRA